MTWANALMYVWDLIKQAQIRARESGVCRIIPKLSQCTTTGTARRAKRFQCREERRERSNSGRFGTCGEGRLYVGEQ